MEWTVFISHSKKLIAKILHFEIETISGTLELIIYVGIIKQISDTKTQKCATGMARERGRERYLSRLGE